LQVFPVPPKGGLACRGLQSQYVFNGSTNFLTNLCGPSS